MESHTSTTMDALERTAAWVQQVQNQVEEMRNSPSVVLEDNVEEMNIIDEDDLKVEASDRDDNSLTDHHDEALKLSQAYSSNKDKNSVTNSDYPHIDIQQTVKEFKLALEKFGISQRFACVHVMENTSQGNLSFLLDKGKTKLWSDISPRGRLPYIRMRRWLDSPDEQKSTLELLQKSKDFKKGSRIGPDSVLNKREKFTVFQLLVLCRVFEEDQNPSLSTRALLADKLEAPLERITIWFQNQRARGFPAKKLLKDANLNKESDLQRFKNLTSFTRKDKGLKTSNTPLSSGIDLSSSNSNSLPTSPLVDSNRPAVTQDNELKVQNTLSQILATTTGSQNSLSSILGTSTVPNPNVSSSQSFMPFPFPIQLLNMKQQGKIDPTSMSSTLPNGQMMPPFLTFPPHIYTSAQTGQGQPDPYSMLNMFQPVSVKQETITVDDSDDKD